MAHVLILGITRTGKTTLAFELARRYKARGTPILVLDPDKRKDWNADYLTDNPEEFLTVCKSNKSCAIFVDESGQMIGRYAPQMEWLATQSRKWGHKAHFITQRASQISPTLRNQCTSIFLFKQSPSDAKIVACDFVCEELKNAPSLLTGEYIAKTCLDKPAFKAKAF